MEISRVAATVIARARDESGLSAPGFDRMISIEGIGGPMGELGNQVYLMANSHMPAVTPGIDNQFGQRNINHTELWLALLLDLMTYEAHCKARTYSGWSNASRGPVRYAS